MEDPVNPDTLNKAAIQEWVTALRSGQYQQGTQTLHNTDDDGTQRYCCLGVACEIFAERLNLTIDTTWSPHRYGPQRDTTHLPDEVANFLGLPTSPLAWAVGPNLDRKQEYLSNLNDNGENFATIATLIEQSYLGGSDA